MEWKIYFQIDRIPANIWAGKLCNSSFGRQEKWSGWWQGLWNILWFSIFYRNSVILVSTKQTVFFHLRNYWWSCNFVYNAFTPVLSLAFTKFIFSQAPPPPPMSPHPRKSKTKFFNPLSTNIPLLYHLKTSVFWYFQRL